MTTAHDALNRPTQIKENGGVLLVDYSGYDDLSRRGTVTLGNGTASGYSYDPQGTLAGLSHNLAGTAQDVAYGYARNQAQGIITHTWSNDAYQWSGAANGTRNYVANGLNQYTTAAGATLGHDASGNINSDGTWTWTYDEDNQLKTATRSGTSVSLAYDAVGRMRQEVLNASTTTQFLYDGTDLVAEYDGSGALLRRYVHGPGVDEPIVAYAGSGTAAKEWLYADHLGSVVASADTAGNSTATYTYGPFGEPNQTAGSRFKYTGQTMMPNLGLYYYKARFYSPVIGRFMQTDPIGYADDLNLYGYVGNNPVDARDPRGAEAVVSKYGNNVYVELTIVYTGANAAALAPLADAAIQKAWTGQNIGEYNIQTMVNSVIATDPAILATYQSQGRTTVNFVPPGDPTLSPWGTSTQSSTAGNWNERAFGVEYAHEAGHIMRLKDRYTSPPYVIDQRWENNIMGSLSGSVDARNISGIVSNAGCGQGCANKPIPTGNGGMTNNSPATLPSGGK